jgi:hypothetical protein
MDVRAMGGLTDVCAMGCPGVGLLRRAKER